VGADGHRQTPPGTARHRQTPPDTAGHRRDRWARAHRCPDSPIPCRVAVLCPCPGVFRPRPQESDQGSASSADPWPGAHRQGLTHVGLVRLCSPRPGCDWSCRALHQAQTPWPGAHRRGLVVAGQGLSDHPVPPCSALFRVSPKWRPGLLWWPGLTPAAGDPPQAPGRRCDGQVARRGVVVADVLSVAVLGRGGQSLGVCQGSWIRSVPFGLGSGDVVAVPHATGPQRSGSGCLPGASV
jgi:hypothetical protein